MLIQTRRQFYNPRALKTFYAVKIENLYRTIFEKVPLASMVINLAAFSIILYVVMEMLRNINKLPINGANLIIQSIACVHMLWNMLWY